MAPPEKLTDEAVARALSGLEGWEREGNGITRTFEFADFTEAFGFLARVAILQEKANHHAEVWSVYNRLKLTLSTHDAGGITERDIDLARQIDGLGA